MGVIGGEANSALWRTRVDIGQGGVAPRRNLVTHSFLFRSNLGYVLTLVLHWIV